MSFFDQAGATPHGFCLFWNPALIWLDVASDFATGVAYSAISMALIYIALRRRDLSMPWMVWLFAIFIFACGTTHFVDIWTLWHADYGVQGILKALTAIASVLTASLLIPVAPRLVAMPSEIRSVTNKLTESEAKIDETQHALAVSKFTTDMMVNAVADTAIYMVDVTGKITSWNTGAERIKGYTADEVIGRHYSIFFTAEDQAAQRPARNLMAANKAGSFRGTCQRVRKDGTIFTADVTIHPVRAPDGRLIGYTKVTHDITEKINAQRELEQTRVELLQAQKMQSIGRLTAGIAHDFNNLLQVILGNLDIIKWREQNMSERSQSMIETVRQAADRGALLTNRLLSFSRKQVMQTTTVYANEIIEGMADMLIGTLAGKADFKAILAEGVWQIRVDRNQMETAILNLIVNAVDAMPEGGKLVIETHNNTLTFDDVRHYEHLEPGDYVTVCVSDTGMGMSKETLAQAFEPFFTTKSVGQGSGLGLSQVYGFARQSRGDLMIVSELGVGTTVRIYLPRWTA
jgi:PAS domain S-box-containing protein